MLDSNTIDNIYRFLHFGDRQNYSATCRAVRVHFVAYNARHYGAMRPQYADMKVRIQRAIMRGDVVMNSVHKYPTVDMVLAFSEQRTEP